MNCEHCQPLLLDHLYGLLDEPEGAAVAAHLAACPACVSARAETARVQGLIARAAKSAFPNTRFEPPAPAKVGSRTPPPISKSAAIQAPAPVPQTGATGRGRTLRAPAVLAWAVAAAVLIAAPSTIVSVLGIFDREAAANRDVRTARRAADDAVGAVETERFRRTLSLNDASLKLTVAEQTQASLLSKWVSAQSEAVQADAGRKLVVEVKKPATVQPGAPNDFLVVVRDGRERWETAGKRMVAEVHAVDASDAVIFSQPLDPERKGDTHPLRLPASAWAQVKPNTELYLVVAQVDEKTQARTELQERVRLAGPAFATLLVTDKATYRPGERLFFRSLTLDRATFRPPGREQVLRYELHRPGDHRTVHGLSVTGTTSLVRVSGAGRVDPVRTADGQPVRGVGCGEFVLPEDLADGDYTLVLREQELPGGLPPTVPMPVTRTVTVRAGAADICSKQVGFWASSFAPGQTVDAWAELKFQDQPLPGAAVTAVTVQADGEHLDGIEAPKATDKDGRVQIRFRLPPEVLDGDVRLTVTFRTPLGGEEAVAQRVPVVGNRLKVEFFPECGDKVVAGVPCKVYVRVTTPAGQPVDIRGTVTDGREELAKVESLRDKHPGANRGLAAFTYTPKLGGRAWLKLDSPPHTYAPILTGGPVPNSAAALFGGPGAVATRTGFLLPEQASDGVVMSVLDPITAPGTPIRVRLHSVGRVRSLVVGAYTRGHLSDTQKVVVEPELPQIVRLMAGPDPRGGVVRVTAFEEPAEVPGEPKPDLKPVAERLVFRKPGEVLKLDYAIRNAAPPLPAGTFRAGDEVKLSITATDEKGAPAAAVLWAAAVNSGVAPGAKDRLMPTHFLLAGEVKNPDDLEYADFLLTDEPKAGEALDLLLGTQGWRRFAEQSTSPHVRGAFPSPDVTRLMVQNGQYATWTEPAPVRDQRKLFETYAPRYEAAVRAVSLAKVELETVGEAVRDTTEIERTAAAAEAAKRSAAEKEAAAVATRVPVQQFRSGVWYGVGGLAAFALCCGGLALARTTGRLPLGFSTLGSVGLAAFLVVAAGWGDDATASAADHTRSVPKLANGDSEPLRVEETRALAAGARASDHAPTVPAPATSGAAIASQKPENFVLPNNKDQPFAQAGANPNFGGSGMGGGAPSKGGGHVASGPPPKEVRPQAISPLMPMPGPKGAAPLPGGGPGGIGRMPPGGNAPSMAPGARPAPPPLAVPFVPPGADVDSKPGRLNDAAPGGPIVTGPAVVPLRGFDRSAPVAERNEDLKRDGDRAAKYATDRAITLAPAVDAYLAVAGKQPASVAVQRYAAQQARVVAAPIPPLVVREYAAPRPEPTAWTEVNAPDTVLWQPVIVLPADGTAALSFHLGNLPGGYQLMIAGHTTDGRLGAARGIVTVVPALTPAPIGPGAPAGAVPPVAPVAPGPP